MSSHHLFVGTWRFVSSEAQSAGGEVSYPFGHNATGYLIYSQDGYMSANIMHANRASFGAADIHSGSPDQKAAAFETYVAYCGRYEVQPEKVIHRVEASLFPDWVGANQVRFFKFAGDQLILSTPPMTVDGVEMTIQVVWRRASALVASRT